jgi:hypothetical protein
MHWPLPVSYTRTVRSSPAEASSCRPPSTVTAPTPRTRRGQAQPHGASTPSQPGQSSCPSVKRDSTRT